MTRSVAVLRSATGAPASRNGAQYERYNDHPDYVRFVQERWLSEVSDFLELDYAAR